MEDASIYDIRKIEVNKKIEEAGGKIIKDEQITPYSFRYLIKCDDDLLDLAKKIENKIEYLANQLDLVLGIITGLIVIINIIDILL